jgi:PAS domain S-box-containing protein
MSLDTAAMVIAGRDGRVTWASPGVLSLLGHEPAKLLGKRIESLVPKEYVARHRRGWGHVWETGKMPPPGGPIMIPVVCADRAVRRFASHLVPLRAPHGELLAVAAVWVPPSDADVDVRQLD